MRVATFHAVKRNSPAQGRNGAEMYDDDQDDREGDTRAWCDKCGDTDFAENMGDVKIEGCTLVLCSRCQEAVSTCPLHPAQAGAQTSKTVNVKSDHGGGAGCVYPMDADVSVEVWHGHDLVQSFSVNAYPTLLRSRDELAKALHGELGWLAQMIQLTAAHAAETKDTRMERVRIEITERFQALQAQKSAALGRVPQ